MKVDFRIIDLTPLTNLNRFQEKSVPVLQFRANLKGQISFSEYRPHVSLGDVSIDEFLENFRDQKTKMSEKVFHFLIHFKDRLEIFNFFNHDFNQSLDAPVIKYKLKDKDDFSFLNFKAPTIRLDANGLFQSEEFQIFCKNIPDLKKIEYIEDPCKDKNWSQFPIKLAADFIQGSPFDYIIYKPMREFFEKNDKPIIFSHYMGSNLGSYLTYLDFSQFGDRNLYHGIVANGLFEENFLFKKINPGIYQIDHTEVSNLLNELHFSSWKSLCQM